jgi:hypothetical protein
MLEVSLNSHTSLLICVIAFMRSTSSATKQLKESWERKNLVKNAREHNFIRSINFEIERRKLEGKKYRNLLFHFFLPQKFEVVTSRRRINRSERCKDISHVAQIC